MAMVERLPALCLLLGMVSCYWQLALGEEPTCTQGEAGCATDELEDVGMLQKSLGQALGKAGPGGACNYSQHQMCDYYGCQVHCPANNVCPTAIGCKPGQLCPNCGKGTACPASGTCQGATGPSASLVDLKSAAIAEHKQLAGPGGACNSSKGQYCDYYGCQVLCPANNVCPSSIGCASGQYCPNCGQSSLACPTTKVCPGKTGPPTLLQEKKARAGPGGACNSTAKQYCDYYGCQVLCPADNTCPTKIGCAKGQDCPPCGQADRTCPASLTCPGKTGPPA